MRDVREGETRLKRATASVFYRAFNRISEVQSPVDVGDFRLVDRRALDVFSQMRESNRFVRGMFSWIGLRQTGVVYKRQERFAGETKYPLRKMLRFATTGVISFSAAPLRAALNLGFFVSFLAFALGIWSVIVKFTGLYEVPGWTSIVVVTTFIGGIQLIVLGVIGEYIGDIHAEVKRRPLYVVSELENFPDLPAELPPRAIVAERRALEPRLNRVARRERSAAVEHGTQACGRATTSVSRASSALGGRSPETGSRNGESAARRGTSASAISVSTPITSSSG